MRTPWHDMWGCGRGPAARLAPQTRILAGTLLFAACLFAPSRTAAGVICAAAVPAVWAAACGMPLRAVRTFAFLGLAMFLPFFLLAPMIMLRPAAPAAGGASLALALAAPWDIFLHGLAAMFTAAATIASLSMSDLRQGLLALPLPHIMSAIVIQIVHQTGELYYETGRVSAALAVRGGSGGGRAAAAMLTSMPRVWLPRVMGRADRVAAAMEARGYAGADLRVMGGRKAGAADAAAVIIGTAVLALSIALRKGWLG